MWFGVSMLLATLLAGAVLIAWRWRLKVQAQEQLCREATRLLEEYEQQKAKLERLLNVHMKENENFEKQRNTAWEMYRAAGSKASSAQTIMLREIRRLVSELNKYRTERGEPLLVVSPGIAKAVEEFKTEHAS